MKIATPTELGHRLQQLLVDCKRDRPSRVRIAAELRSLAEAVTIQQKSASGDPILMGAWDGNSVFWPEPKGYDITIERRDKYQDAYQVWYQRVGDGSSFIVEFDALAYINSQGKRPGKWQATQLHGKSIDGTWSSVTEIPQILAKVEVFDRKAEKEAEAELLKLGGSRWECSYEYNDLRANYLAGGNDDGEAWLAVDFRNVMGVLAGEGDSTDTAVTHYCAGADYEGNYGEREVENCYRTVEDMERILGRAEKLWVRWNR